MVRFSGGNLLAESAGERYATKISATGCDGVEFGFNLDYMADALEQFGKEPSVKMKVSAGSLGPIIFEAPLGTPGLPPDTAPGWRCPA